MRVIRRMPITIPIMNTRDISESKPSVIGGFIDDPLVVSGGLKDDATLCMDVRSSGVLTGWVLVDKSRDVVLVDKSRDVVVGRSEVV